MRRIAVPVVVLLGVTACSSPGTASKAGEALVVVSAPLTAQPWIGQFLDRGARLAAEQVNAGKGRHIRVEVLVELPLQIVVINDLGLR